MMRYVMMRIHGTHAPTKHRRSPGVHCTSQGRLGGDEPARLTDAKPGTKGRQGLKWRVWRLPTVTAFISSAQAGRRSGTDGRRGQAIGAWARASLWTAPAATVSPARSSKSGSSLGDEGARGIGAKLA